MSVLLAARNLTKRFPGVVALRDVNFQLQPGEIHALCGENGAGKSTLIKLLAGIHAYGSYEGGLSVGGREVRFRGIRDAEAAGIAVITQELALVDDLSVAENIFLGRLPRRGLRVDWADLHQRAAKLLQEFALPLSPEMPVRHLGIGQKQLLEIIRAIDKRSRVLVLDEPTAALTSHEIDTLLEQVRRLRQRGTACIYISHKLDEVLAIADRITVLRDGASVATLARAEADVPMLIKHMVGREVTDIYPRTGRSAAAAGSNRPMLTVRNLSVSAGKHAPPFLRQLSFEARAGQVLGFGGLMGAGRTELLMHLFGAWGHRTAGEVRLENRDFSPRTPRDAIGRGVVLATEDRRRYGLILAQSVGFNLSLSSLARVAPRGRIRAISEFAGNQRLFNALHVRAAGLDVPVATLSGGNQQKVVLGKVLMREPAVVLLDEPTRGIDVGAKQEIYALIKQLTEDGKAVLLVSSELPELMGLSDRIIMISRGRVGGEFARGEFTQEKLLAAAMATNTPSQ